MSNYNYPPPPPSSGQQPPPTGGPAPNCPPPSPPPNPPVYVPPPWFFYRKPTSPWVILGWVLGGILAFFLLWPALKIAMYTFGGGCSLLFTLVVVVLATWKAIELLILLFRKLFPPAPPVFYPPQ